MRFANTRIAKTVAALGIVGAVATGCTTAEQAGTVGAVGGGAIGAAVTGDVGGAAVGAFIGGVGGYLLGRTQDGRCQYRDRQGDVFYARCP